MHICLLTYMKLEAHSHQEQYSFKSGMIFKPTVYRYHYSYHPWYERAYVCAQISK